MKHEDISSYADQIDSHADFVKFVQFLKKNYKENSAEWENDNIETYLDGIFGFTKSLKSYYYLKKENVNLDKPSWRIIARILLAARVYE